MSSERQVCTRCVMDSTAPAIRFDQDGRCSYCRLHDRMEVKLASLEGTVERLCQEIQKAGQGRSHDCVVGVSGGTDSTYCLYLVKKLGLRPLAVHFDNGWVSDVARANIQAMSAKLGVEVRTVKADWDQLKTWYRACFTASVPEMCMPCEVGIASALYRVAAEAGVGTIVLGHSFRTEGITPLAWHYLDGRYFESVLEGQGASTSASDAFNGLKLASVGTNMLWRGIRTVQLPLYVRGYHDEKIRATLAEELGWVYGGHHHFDCVYKPFVGHVQARKFDIDLRKVALSALVRTGQVQRDQALAALAQPSAASDAEIATVLERLGLSREEYDRVLSQPPKDFSSFSSYYSLLRGLRLPLKAATRLRVVPETLYEKLFET